MAVAGQARRVFISPRTREYADKENDMKWKMHDGPVFQIIGKQSPYSYENQIWDYM